MDPQYAIVDQLAEITDTMASLKDAILGWGQRIDGHQAQPIPLQRSTPHDYAIPPLPPSSHTIKQDHMVPLPPPPLVQSAPQAVAFFCMGRLRLHHILLWHLHRLQMIPRPALIGLSRGWYCCTFQMELWAGMGMMIYQLQPCLLRSACQILRDT